MIFAVAPRVGQTLIVWHRLLLDYSWSKHEGYLDRSLGKTYANLAGIAEGLAKSIIEAKIENLVKRSIEIIPNDYFAISIYRQGCNQAVIHFTVYILKKLLTVLARQLALSLAV